MKEFIEFIVKHLVDQPDLVKVNEVNGERTVVFELAQETWARSSDGVVKTLDPCESCGERRPPSRASGRSSKFLNDAL